MYYSADEFKPVILSGTSHVCLFEIPGPCYNLPALMLKAFEFSLCLILKTKEQVSLAASQVRFVCTV